MSVQTLREFINRHTASVAGLGALGALLDARASGAALDPALAAGSTALVDALGGTAALDDVAPADAAQFLAELRQVFGADIANLYRDQRTSAWTHHDERLLLSVGEFSRGFARGLTRNIIPALDGLTAKLDRFLDVGVGVAALSVELASLWPQLKITGIDVWAPSIALAQKAVAAAGLADRIELRTQGAEALTDERAFDLAWLPIIFIPEPIIEGAIERTFAALRPGGWLVASFANIDLPDPVMRAFWRLRTTMFGGPMWSASQAEAALSRAGFAETRVLPSPPGAPILLAARRPI